MLFEPIINNVQVALDVEILQTIAKLLEKKRAEEIGL